MNKILIPQMPDFAGIRSPSIDFQEVRDMRRSLPWYVDVDLATARSLAAGTASIINAAGTVIFIDQDPSVGNATMHFQDTTQGITSSPIYVAAGSIFQIPFTQLLIENIAQTGKKLRIHFGVDLDFKPSLSSALNISGTISTVDIGSAWQTSYKSTTALLANTLDNIFAAASNTAGGTLWAAGTMTGIGGLSYPFGALVMKATAPASQIDGDTILISSNASQGSSLTIAGMTLPNPIRFGSGKRLDYVSNSYNESVVLRHALYTLN